MNVPEEFMKMIIDEFGSIEEMFNENPSIDDKLYFFSGSFGVINRVMNFHTDPTLIFIHQILQAAHQSFSQRYRTPEKPGTIVNSIPDELFNGLFSSIRELKEAFRINKDEEIWRVLQKISNLTYATTGNGFYLYICGKLVINP